MKSKQLTRTIYGRQYKFTLMPDGNYWMTENLTATKQGVHQDIENETEYFTFGQANSLKLPKDVHVPSKDDFIKLVKALGVKTGKKLIRSDFQATFSGFYYDGLGVQGGEGNYWSSTAVGTGVAYGLNFYDDYVYPGNGSYKDVGYAVRCVIYGAPKVVRSPLKKKVKKYIKYQEPPHKFLCRIDGDLWKALHNRAAKDGITMTALINFILKVYTERTGSDEPTSKVPVGGEIYKKIGGIK